MTKHNPVKSESVRSFRWSGLVTAFIWFMFQNVFVEMVVYRNQLSGQKISWAPLTPLGSWVNPTIFTIGTSTCTLQGQMPWLIMTPVFYFVLLLEYRRFEIEKRK